jgi:hypothetical protein
MARTVGEAVASARHTLNDEDGTRCTTEELEDYARDAVNFVRQRRPDLFLGNWGAIGTLAGNAALPLDDQYFRPIVDYLIARAETKDDEAVVAARAKLMVDMAGGFLK